MKAGRGEVLRLRLGRDGLDFTLCEAERFTIRGMANLERLKGWRELPVTLPEESIQNRDRQHYRKPDRADHCALETAPQRGKYWRQRKS